MGRSEPLGGHNGETLRLAERLGRRRKTGSGRVCGRIRSSLVVPPRWAWTGGGGGGGVGGGRDIGLGPLLSGTLRPRLKSIPGVSLCDGMEHVWMDGWEELASYDDAYNHSYVGGLFGRRGGGGDKGAGWGGVTCSGWGWGSCGFGGWGGC